MDKQPERVDNNDDGLAGIVPESPRSDNETASSDATLDPAVAREDVTRPGNAGLAADDPDAGDERKKAYERGAILVSRID
jgi:hypothetical protein